MTEHMTEPIDLPATHPQPVAAAGPFPDPALPVRSPSRWERLRGPLVTAGIVGGLTVALHFRDPHSEGSWGVCPWFALTGAYCPGCGGLRAVNDLTNGDLAGAASSNLVFVLMVPVLVLWWARWTRRAWVGGDVPDQAAPRRRPVPWIAVFVVVTIVFGVVRNLSFGSWLAP